MKPIRHLAIAFITVCAISSTQAQTTNCDTDFWTITVDGYIQQWSLSNGTISGGDTILSGGGTSLSYCGNSNAPTFFSNNSNFPYTGFTYYNADSGWVNIPTTSLPVNNNGGHLNDQYYMVEGGVIQIVKYWDGVNLLTVVSLHLNNEFFAGTQDIAVDTLGQAWIFTGSTPSIVDSLKVYDQYGKIDSYSITFDEIAYGSFFLNDTLYIGTYQDSIFPVIISGSTAQLGNPIPFNTSNFTDIASCQKTESTASVSEYSSTIINLFPNPTDGNFSIDLGENHQTVKVIITDLGGRLIQSNNYNDSQLLKLKLEEPSGIYLLMVESGNKKAVIRLVKE